MEDNVTYLVDGEKFNLKASELEKNLLSEQEINDKYRKGEMRIVTEQGRIDLHSIISTLNSETDGKKKYTLNPEYQRRKRWDNRRKSLLIESFIINVPIPPIFLYEVEYAIYEVMDGQQRLTTIRDFYEDKFSLEGLEYWRELNGKKYSELPKNVKAGIDRRYLSSIVLLEETAKSEQEAEFLKKIVFGRLNSGGEKLTSQEMRNALLSGKFNKLCIELAQNDSFRKLWHYPLESEIEELLFKSEDEIKETTYSVSTIESYRKMQDVELVLRFFAYRHLEHWGGQLDLFLDQYLKNANEFPDSTLINLKNIFLDTIELIFKILGQNAFLLPGKKYKSPTKTMYDGLMQAFSQNTQHKQVFLDKKYAICDKFYGLGEILDQESSHESKLFDGRYNHKNNVQARIDYFRAFLEAFISKDQKN